jgi:hypothetical protein
MVTVILVTALLLPVVVYWLLRSRSHLSGLVAAVIAIASGWALNLVWAFVAHESFVIAAAFGWVCPTVLVSLTWLVWRFTRRRAA